MRVLVTGAAGLVGSRLAARFVREGVSVRALDRTAFARADVECLQADVTDREQMRRAVADVDLLAHCAAVIAGAAEETTRVNIDGTRGLLEAAVDAGCQRALCVSTALVYDFGDRTVVDESTPLLREGPPFHMSRVRAEEIAWAAGARGLPVTLFRPYMILGAHPTSTASALLPQQIVRGEFVMRGDGSGSFPYVHVDNLVDAIVLAWRTPGAVGQAYNIVDGHTTARAYLDRLCRRLGVEPLTARGELVPWRGRLDGTKAERDLGYRPRVSYEDAMRETERYVEALGLCRR